VQTTESLAVRLVGVKFDREVHDVSLGEPQPALEQGLSQTHGGLSGTARMNRPDL
jgi:hypothetical protein